MDTSFMPPQIIVALDFPDLAAAKALVDRLDPTQCRVKVGKEMFTRFGPAFVSYLVERDFDVFLDLKFHDIPHTVHQACRAAAELGVWMLNVHASGGEAMLAAAREAINASTHQPLLIAVTLLTSLQQSDITALGWAGEPRDVVRRLALLAQQAGCDGVVCSPQEAALLRTTCGDDFCLVTPGIRPAGSAVDDQKRTMTPAEALHAGANYLVIGRPITQAADPLSVVSMITTGLH